MPGASSLTQTRPRGVSTRRGAGGRHTRVRATRGWRAGAGPLPRSSSSGDGRRRVSRRLAHRRRVDRPVRVVDRPAARPAGSAASAATASAARAREGEDRRAARASRFAVARASSMPRARFASARARALPGPRRLHHAVAERSVMPSSPRRARSNSSSSRRLARAPVAPAARHLRPQAPARRPGGGRSTHVMAGDADAGDHADRRRQVAVLPAARAAPAGHDARRLAADRADEGPVRQAARARRRRRAAQQRARAPTRATRPSRRSPRARRRSSSRRPSGWPTPHFLDALRGASGRACSSSTRRTASRSGATTSARPSSRSAARCRASASRRCSR